MVQQAGPAAVLSFLIAGGLIVLVMRMPGEMACAMPAVGSLYEYARQVFAGKRGPGKLAGFLTGWMYWYFWVIVVTVEAAAGAKLVRLRFGSVSAIYRAGIRSSGLAALPGIRGTY